MVIGLTGGIGSGKSIVRNYLSDRYDAGIIDSDSVAKKIMEPGSAVYPELVSRFPEAFSCDECAPDSSVLSSIVFSDKKRLSDLNSITHPAVINEIIRIIKEMKNDIIVVESALLCAYPDLLKNIDEIWYVYCEEETRIDRLISDRGYTYEEAIKIISSQPKDEEYNYYADEFIDNSKDLFHTYEQIDYLLMTNNEC